MHDNRGQKVDLRIVDVFDQHRCHDLDNIVRRTFPDGGLDFRFYELDAV